MSFDSFANEVRKRLEDAPPPEVVRGQRERVVESMSAARRGRPRTLRWGALAFVGLVASGIAAFFVVRSFDGDGALVRGKAADLESSFDLEERWLQAPDDEGLAVSTPEHADLRLAPRTRARLRKTAADHVGVTVESGRIDVHVPPRRGVRWTFHAGAYRVEVVGTTFYVEHRVAMDGVEVGVTEGQVLLAGGRLGPEGVMLSAGDRARLGKEGVAIEPLAETPLEASGPSSVPDGAPADRARPPPSTDDWRARHRVGDYRGAIRRAEALGFERLLARGSADDLSLLGDAARLAGDEAKARSVLLTLRKRFPGSPEATSAAFLLGRLEADVKRDLASAASYFELYLQEAPRGPHAELALGRLITLYQRLDRTDDAHAVSSRYLERHPGGPYADLARAVLEPR